jgi:hypothetical protein
MADIFTAVIERLRDIGAFTFLFPFMLTSAIFYGLLRKSQIFGKAEENTAVNAVVALVAAFMVWAYPIMIGVSLETQLAAFFTQGIVVTLVFMIALMIVGMFLPQDMSKHLAEGLLHGNKALLVVVVALFFGFLIVLTSGLWGAVFGPGVIEISGDIIVTVIVIVLLIIPFIFILYPSKKPPERSGQPP